MASKLQSRLVGTMILVAIGVIVLPDVLDGKKAHYEEDFVGIPIKPTIDTTIEEFQLIEPPQAELNLLAIPVEAEPVDDIALESNHSSAAEVTEKSSQSVKQPVKIKVEPNPQLQQNAWIIQLMALRNAENAQGVVEDLRKRGYQAHIKLDNGLSRVIIGPDLSRDKLESQLSELEKITGSKGQIRTFKPLNP